MTTTAGAGSGGVAIGWLGEGDIDLDGFVALVATGTDPLDYPHAEGIETNLPVYQAAAIERTCADPAARRDLQAEVAGALLEGPGVVAVRGAFDAGVVDRATEVFSDLIERERAQHRVHGDHYAPPGANERMWDALGKLALATPSTFADYYANPLLALVAEAWLGPGFQLTSAVNIVNPGGPAQTIHCDYHLGFQTNEAAARYPAHVHRLSQVLTLQGAIAHVDMGVESGPTIYVPHSQKFRTGYLAWRDPEISRAAQSHAVQPALSKGDAVFFNPGLFHAAGENRTTACRRMANLLQISSAFGRAMDSVDRTAMVEALFPVLTDRRQAGAPESWLRAVVGASAEAYPFPTNLDRDVPVGSLTPPSQADLVWQGLVESWTPQALHDALVAQEERRRPDPRVR